MQPNPNSSAGKIVSTLFARLRGQKNLADALSAFVVRVLAAFLAYGVQVFLARTLALGDYGIYVTLWTWLIVFNHMAAFGFSESSLRFLPRYAHRRKHAWARGYLETGFKTVIVGASLAGAFGLAVLWFAGDTIPTAYLLPLIVLCIGLPFTSLEVYLEGVSRSFGWYMLTIVPAYVLRPLLLAVGVVAALALGYAPNAATVLSFAIIATAGIVIGQAILIRARVAKLFPDSRSSGPRKLWVFASLPLVLTLAVDEIFTWSDILILGFMVSPEEVSVYFAAQRSMSLAAFVQFAFMMVMVRDFSLANARRDPRELQKRISNASSWTFWLTVPAVALTLAAGYPLLAMFGSEFVAGYGVMAVLGIGFMIRASTGQAQDLLIVLGHQRANVVISGGCILLNIALSILLIPGFGIMGAALATTATLAVRSVAFTFATRKLAGLWVLAGIPDLGAVRSSASKTIEKDPANLVRQT